MPGTEKDKKLKQIRDEIWNLKNSPLYKHRRKNNYYPVIGEGSHEAEIMLIGEAPGENEAKTGRPFCGAAGNILDQLFDVIEIKREETYVTNIVKDRPPKNRDPTTEEIKVYSPFLIRQINIIEPKVIVSLGRFAMHFTLNYFGLGEKIQSISKIHGKVMKAETSYGKVKIIPLYHPAVAVYNRNKLPEMKENFKKIEKLINEG
ncbi:MAG: uracil-DNA glycosylase [Candidatus Nealsonbacteria bacterium]|nr:uracil-DNA glycosylase [Candidatus Nealsonbacteria bacterium]